METRLQARSTASKSLWIHSMDTWYLQSTILEPVARAVSSWLLLRLQSVASPHLPWQDRRPESLELHPVVASPVRLQEAIIKPPSDPKWRRLPLTSHDRFGNTSSIADK